MRCVGCGKPSPERLCRDCRTKRKCAVCGTLVSKDEAEFDREAGGYVCRVCKARQWHYCAHCGRALDTLDTAVCDVCAAYVAPEDWRYGLSS